jgi:transitional endoplasmic reticulum ATPase
MILFPIEHP